MLICKTGLVFTVSGCSWKGNNIADIGNAGQIHDAALKAKTEACMPGSAVFAQIQIKIIILRIHTGLLHAQIILADEPTGNLDTENSTQIIQLLSRLAHEENCCVVVVTHDLEVAKAADVVFRMDSGRLKEETV